MTNRLTRSAGRWVIHWHDRNLTFDWYSRKHPTNNVQSLLDDLENSGDPTFWG